MMRRIHSAARRLRLALENVSELNERRLLLDRPWEEEFLHWAHEEGAPADRGWHLHGHWVPPGRGRRSVTRSGWCPGLAAHRAAGAPRTASRQEG